MIQAGRRHGSLTSMSLCKYRSSAHLLKLTGKLVCDVARLVSIMIIRDDVISVAKLQTPDFEEMEAIGGRGWYHSKERW